MGRYISAVLALQTRLQTTWPPGRSHVSGLPLLFQVACTCNATAVLRKGLATLSIQTYCCCDKQQYLMEANGQCYCWMMSVADVLPLNSAARPSGYGIWCARGTTRLISVCSAGSLLTSPASSREHHQTGHVQP